MKCGKANCHCHTAGPKHGPFFYLNPCLPKGRMKRLCSKLRTKSTRRATAWPLTRKSKSGSIRSVRSTTNCSAEVNRSSRTLHERTGSVFKLHHQSVHLQPGGAQGAGLSALSSHPHPALIAESVAGGGRPRRQLPGHCQANQTPALATFGSLVQAHQRRRVSLCQ